MPPSTATTPIRAARVEQLALVALLGGALCIALSAIFVRLSELAPTATAFHRLFLALPLFAAWIAWEDASAAPRPARGRLPWGWLALSGFFFAGDLATWHWSIAYTTVANATLLANFALVFVTVAAWFLFGERVGPRFVAGMLLAFCGAAVLLRAGLAVDSGRLLGDALGLVTAAFYAGYMIAVKELRRRLDTARLMGYSTLISAALLLPIVLAAGEDLVPETLYGWTVLFALAWISQAAGQGLIAYAFAHLSASFSSVTLLVQPAAAAFFAWIILGEGMTPLQASGGLAVLAGILLARSARRG